MRAGQTQAVTAIIITGITLAAVTATYVWGTPILEKRQSQQQLVQTEQEVQQLYSSINSISDSGQGTTERVTLEFSSGVDISANETGNYIQFSRQASSSPYARGTWFLLEGERLQGLSIGEGTYGQNGQDRPGVIAVKAEGSNGVTLNYRIEYRNLYVDTSSGPMLSQTDLQVQGGNRATGETTVILSNQGTETDAGTDAVETETGETLNRERTVVSVEFR